MSALVDNVIDDLQYSMVVLKDRLRGIPYRAGSFRNQYRRFAQDVGYLMVQLEAARHMIGDEKSDT